MTMKGYLGQVVVEQKDTKFADFDKSDWAMYFIKRYGQFDGGHHKAWVLDQVVRILQGTPVIIELAKWDNGHQEYRVSTDDEPSEEYNDWVKDMLGEWNEDEQSYEYDYDEGIAP